LQFYGEMGQAMREAADDDEVRVIVLTGAGRAFHTGDDVREIFVGEDRNVNRWKAALAKSPPGGVISNLAIQSNGGGGK